MNTATPDGGSRPGERLERALDAFLAQPPHSAADTAHLLAQHPELRDLLEPMIEGSAAIAPPDTEQPDGDSEVLGDYRLVRELGRGGMGIVYEAWQRSLDRKVAVKVLAPALVASPSAIARFRREAAAAGRLRHRNIVEVYGFGSSDSRHFFAMQLVDGVSLHDCMARFRAPGAATVLAIQIADALSHAHAAGLVHRDVKPANVLVQPDGTALLTDFGVASDAALPSLTREGGFLGTLDYAAPEQVRGDAVDARCDVFSVGVLLYEALTGEHPFRAATQQATMQHILTTDPPLRGIRAASKDLAAVVGRALEKDPSRRYASAAALLADLRALQQGAAVSARLPTPSERIVRWARREPWRALAACVLLVGLPILAGTLGFLWANAPRIETGRAVELAREREELLARAWWYALEDDVPAALAELDATPPPHDTEVMVTRAALLMRAKDHAAARAVLANVDGKAAELLRAELATDAPAPEVVDDDSLDDLVSFVRAATLAEQLRINGSRDPKLVRQAANMAQRALALAPQPRLAYLVTLSGICRIGGDAATSDLVERALGRHFPDSPVARRIRAEILTRSAPERGLAMLDAKDGRLPSAGTALLRGVALEALGRLDEALAANRQAVAEQPQRARAWTNLGVVLRKRKQYAESEQALRHALELAPRDEFAWNSLGLTLRSADDHAHAAEAFERAVQIRPSYGPAAFNLGNLRLADGDTSGAIEAFQRAVDADPGDARAITNLGNALLRAGRQQDALPHLLRGAQLAPREVVPQYNLARTALDLQLFEIAVGAARRAAELDTRYHGNWVLADALLASPHGDVAAALAAARVADERVRGKETGVRITLARAVSRNGDRSGAIALLEQSKQEPEYASDADREALAAAIAALRAEPTAR